MFKFFAALKTIVIELLLSLHSEWCINYLGLQITLKLDPETEIKKYGPRPGPLDEIEVMAILSFSW